MMERSRKSGSGAGRRLARLAVAISVAGSVLVPSTAASASDLVVDVTVPHGVAIGDAVPVTVAVSGRAAAGSQRLSVEIYRETAPGSGAYSGPIAGSQVLDTPRTGPQPRTVTFDYPAAHDELDDVVVACVAPSARVGANTVETHCRVGDGRTVRPVPRTFVGTTPQVGQPSAGAASVSTVEPSVDVVSVTPAPVAPGATATVTVATNLPGEVTVDARRSGTDAWTTTPVSGTATADRAGTTEIDLDIPEVLTDAVAGDYDLRVTLGRSGVGAQHVAPAALEIARQLDIADVEPGSTPTGTTVDVTFEHNIDEVDASCRAYLVDATDAEVAGATSAPVDCAEAGGHQATIDVPHGTQATTYDVRVDHVGDGGATTSDVAADALQVDTTVRLASASPTALRPGAPVTVSGDVNRAGHCQLVLSGAASATTDLVACGPGDVDLVFAPSQPGSYDVALRFVAPDGAETTSAVVTDAVSVVAPPTVSIATRPGEVDPGDGIVFDLGTDEAGTCTVTLTAGGSTTTLQPASFPCGPDTTHSPTFTAPGPGSYVATLQFVSGQLADTFTATAASPLVVVDPVPPPPFALTRYTMTESGDRTFHNIAAQVHPVQSGIAVRYLYLLDGQLLFGVEPTTDFYGIAYGSFNTSLTGSFSVIACTDFTDVAPTVAACQNGNVAARDTREANAS